MHPYDKCLPERPFFNKYTSNEFKEKSTGRTGINVECCKTRKCSNCQIYFYPIKVEPDKVEPVKIDPVKVEPVKIDPDKIDPVKVDDLITNISDNMSELGKKYYFVHNYMKTDKIIPYTKLQPRGDTRFKGLEDYVKTYRKYFDKKEKQEYNLGLDNYKEYINSLSYNTELPPAQSNIGIFFWLIPKEKINNIIKSEGFININKNNINKPINNFSYIFDVDKMIKYVLSVNSFDNNNTIPKIYWSDSNIYGLIYPSRTIRGFNHMDFTTTVDKSMIANINDAVKKHEVVSLVSIDITDKNSGFLGLLPQRFNP